MYSRSDPGVRADVTTQSLREWPLPVADGSKYGRGHVVVVGGALRSPGAAMLAGIAALRVGAGRLTLAVGASAAAHVATAVPECGVVPLDETPGRSVSGFGLAAASADLSRADAVLLGPGLDDAGEAEVMVRELPRYVGVDTVVVLDAFALGSLPRVAGIAERLGGRLVLTPNTVEAGLLLGRDVDDLARDLGEISDRFAAVVTCFGVVTAPDGWSWHVGAASSGLGTSGSGDVLAGAVAGLAARGAPPEQAAVWATHLHVATGHALDAEVAPTGYLASELVRALPGVLADVEGAR